QRLLDAKGQLTGIGYRVVGRQFGAKNMETLPTGIDWIEDNITVSNSVVDSIPADISDQFRKARDCADAQYSDGMSAEQAGENELAIRKYRGVDQCLNKFRVGNLPGFDFTSLQMALGRLLEQKGILREALENYRSVLTPDGRQAFERVGTRLAE